MTPNFRFNVGDLVIPKATIDAAKIAARFGAHGVPVIMSVVEQRTNACTAGTQLSYLCSNMGQAAVFQEHELEPLSAYPTDEIWDIWLAANLKIRHAIKEAEAWNYPFKTPATKPQDESK